MNLKEKNEKFKTASIHKALEWILLESKLHLTLACSFSKEDIVLIDMMANIIPQIDIFFLDTGRLHEETYEQLDSIKNRYKHLNLRVFFPQSVSVQNLIETKGAFSFYESIENRKECCAIRKVEPLGRALKGYDAWMTGLRQEHSPSRESLLLFEEDHAHDSILKINPLYNWSAEQLDSYIKKNKLPVHALHKQGYPSIGCAPCSRAVEEGGDFRSGRWWWESSSEKECGLH